jgi:thioredoxin-related protein
MAELVSHNPGSKPKRADIFLLLVLLGSLSLNVYLGWKVRHAEPTSNFQSIVRIEPGTKVMPLRAVDMDGQPHLVSYNDVNRPTVVYVIAPSCIWCERNRENIDQVARLKGNEFRFVGLSLAVSGLKEYLGQHNLSFPVYTVLDSETIKAFGLGATPQTIVISPDGKVLKNWTGAYREQSQREVEEYFHLSLPGLVSANR